MISIQDKSKLILLVRDPGVKISNCHVVDEEYHVVVYPVSHASPKITFPVVTTVVLRGFTWMIRLVFTVKDA
jgi:hypothetical protein